MTPEELKAIPASEWKRVERAQRALNDLHSKAFRASQDAAADYCKAMAEEAEGREACARGEHVPCKCATYCEGYERVVCSRCGGNFSRKPTPVEPSREFCHHGYPAGSCGYVPPCPAPTAAPDDMRVYQVAFDSEHKYVEAHDFAAAIRAWHGYMKREQGNDWNGDEQPDSVTLMGDGPVIRERFPEVKP